MINNFKSNGIAKAIYDDLITKSKEEIIDICSSQMYLINQKDKEIERLNNELELQNIEMGREIERLNKRFDTIKDYLKQIRKENQEGILSSYSLIEDNIVRLCNGEKLLGSDKE